MERLSSSGPARKGMTIPEWWEYVDSTIHKSGLLGLYGQFMREGDLVFDIGACNGTRTRIFRMLGAKVIAVEPLAIWGDEFIPELFWRFGQDLDVTIIPLALSDKNDRMEICIQRFIPCMSSVDRTWMEDSAHHGYYNEKSVIRRQVECVTLDAIREQYGEPDFCKIDVEGHENAVVRGMTWAPSAFNLEYHADWIPMVAMQRLDALASEQGYRYEYNYVLNTQAAWQLQEWVSSNELVEWLHVHLTPEGNGSWGDLYGRRVG